MPFSLLGRSKERIRSQGSSEEGAPRCMGQPGMSGNLRFPCQGPGEFVGPRALLRGPGLPQHLGKGPWLLFVNCLPGSPRLELPNLLYPGWAFPCYRILECHSQPTLGFFTETPALVKTAMPQSGPFAWNPSFCRPPLPSLILDMHLLI
ncbi:mCG147225 [Mus musculus]|nr:mCG147225 [Mus musculus]